jgi:hypothetical protein
MIIIITGRRFQAKLPLAWESIVKSKHGIKM